MGEDVLSCAERDYDDTMILNKTVKVRMVTTTISGFSQLPTEIAFMAVRKFLFPRRKVGKMQKTAQNDFPMRRKKIFLLYDLHKFRNKKREHDDDDRLNGSEAT